MHMSYTIEVLTSYAYVTNHISMKCQLRYLSHTHMYMFYTTNYYHYNVIESIKHYILMIHDYIGRRMSKRKLRKSYQSSFVDACLDQARAHIDRSPSNLKKQKFIKKRNISNQGSDTNC